MSSTIEFFITITCISTHSIISWWCISSIKHSRKHKLWYMNNPYLCVQLFFNIFHLFYVVLSSKRSAPTGRGASSPTDRQLLSDQPQWLWGGEWVSSIVYVFSWFFGRCLFFSESSSLLDVCWICGLCGADGQQHFVPYIPQKGIALLRLRLDHKMAFPWRICTCHSRPNKTSKKNGEIVRPWWDLNPFRVSKLKFHYVSFIPRKDYGYIKKKKSVHNPFPLITHQFKVPCRNIYIYFMA